MPMTKTTELQPLPVTLEGETWPLFLQRGSAAPLVRDLDLASWLGYERPHEIRRLIERHADELGFFVTVTKNPDGRGRPGTDNYLTQEQALYLIAKSETAKAVALLKVVINVFLAATNGLLGPQAPIDREEIRALVREALREELPSGYELLTAVEVAARLGMPLRTFWRRVDGLRHLRVGMKWPWPLIRRRLG